MKVARFLVAAVLALGAVHVGLAQQNQAAGSGLDVVKVRPNFFVLAGAGGNVAVNIGPDGVIVVDTGTAERADAVIAEIKKLTPLPVRYIINTSDDPDHIGGNEKVALAGRSLFLRGNLGPGGGAGGGNTGINNNGAASIIGAENMYLRMSESGKYATVGQPTESFQRRLKVMYLNDQSIQIIHPSSAHTDGDSLVLFRQADVIVAGDVFDMTKFPVIDLARGGSIKGELEILNQLIDLAVPSIPLPWKEGGTTVIPGHGRLAEQAELVEYRDMVTIVTDRVQDMINQRMTLDQIKAAKPTKGWDRRFGSDSGAWTTSMFIEAVYKSLTAAPKTPRT